VYRNSVFLNSFNVTGNDTLLTGLEQGSYDIEYLLDGVAYDTANVVVSSFAPVVSSATLSDNSPTVGQSVVFTNTSTGAATYFWDFGDGFNSTTTSPNHDYSSPDTYTVTLTATSAAGCTATSTYVITVSAFSLVGPPTNMNREEEDPNLMARTSAQVQSQNNQAAITVRGDATVSQFSVYSMNGQLLLVGSAADRTFTYNTPGIYLIHVLYTDGTSEIKQWYLN
jgi:PKD repeat protein